jgi:hypothetical protein
MTQHLEASTAWACKDEEADIEAEVHRRMEAILSHGYVVRQGWDAGAPFVEFVNGDRQAWLVRHIAGLLDHLYRIVTPEETVYVSEPYDLYDFDGIAKARESGWDVTVSAARALHYPGRTVAVVFRRMR